MTTQSDTDVNTIDSMIKTVNQLYKDIQLQDGYQGIVEGVMEGHTPEHVIITSRSTGVETLEEITSKLPPTTGGDEGTGFERTRSAPPRSLPHPVNQIRKLQRALRGLKRNIKHMKSLQLDVETEVKKQYDSLSLLVKGPDPSGASHMSLTNCIEKDLENITKKLLDLKNKVPVSPEKLKSKKASPDYEGGDGNNNGKVIACLPGIHANVQDLKRLAVFRQVREKFNGLVSNELKICLLSFAVFPENQEVNRTMLMYWWIGEGFLPDKIKPDESMVPDSVKPKKGFRLAKEKPSEKDRPEDVVKAILEELVEQKLIEPVENKRKVEPNSYKMSPFVHSSLVLISKEIGLFDMYHAGEKPTMQQSKLNKVCLVEGSSSQRDVKATNMPRAEHIETLLNVSERFPDFTSKWFSSMRKLKVLYLGRWDRTEREIEVDSRRVMKDLGSLRRLRFLSFQGISTIKSLSRSACKLTVLIILDLRGCYNLEKLPDDIQKLKNLVYLDLTGCEALETIPMGLASLSNLEVLKGFVVSDDREIACKLNDLKRLSKLRKLSVIVDREGFGLAELIAAVGGFDALEKLKVWWGSVFSIKKKQRDAGKIKKKPKDDTSAPSQPKKENPFRTITRTAGLIFGPREDKQGLPQRLRKLDLQRFPDSELPDWLQPQNLNGDLETLHLGSSRRLKGFGGLPAEPTKCGVKVLRLMCLPKLRVEWSELTQLYFPRLRFLESYECPRVTFCPCDRDGIWRADE